MRLLSTAALALALAAPALAQETVTLQVNQSEEYGQYLATAEDRPVYMFTTDTRGTGAQEAEISCTSQECLGAWPLVTGNPEAGEGVSAEMLGTTQYEGRQVVTYNGWPLYYFARDEGAEAPQGQDVHSFGGEWYLVAPSGERVGH